MKLPYVGMEYYTTVDYPNKMSGTLFVRGCNFKCSYCHNANIAYKKLHLPELEDDVIMSYLDKRKEWLDAIVLSGGEVLIYPIEDIIADIETIRKYSYLIGLHTNGYNTDKLKHLLDKGLIDFVGIDFKSTRNKYNGVTGIKDAYDHVIDSIKVLVDSGIDYEVRTTVHPAMLSLDNLKEMIDVLSELGVEKFVYQRFQPNGVEDEFLINTYNANALSGEIIQYAEDRFRSFTIR